MVVRIQTDPPDCNTDVLFYVEMKMIDPRELRIGNLFLPVFWQNSLRIKDSVPCVVAEISSQGIKSHEVGKSLKKRSPSSTFTFENIDAVPIHQEWLVKLRFVRDHHIFSYGDSSMVFSLHYVTPREFAPYFNDRVINEKLRVYTVHQAQNLYYAITGKELDISNVLSLW